MDASRLITDDKILLGPSMVVEVAAEPKGDVIFLPSDSRGTPGTLNSEILSRLGLPLKLPDRSKLERGYAFQPGPRGLICYIVTVGRGSTDRALRDHLRQALGSREVIDARSIWLPLMGTGTGSLKLERSFEIIFEVLRDSGWLYRPGVRATISIPEKLPHNSAEELGAAIYRAREALTDETGTNSETPSDVYKLAKVPAVESLLAFAGALSKLNKPSGRRLSSTLLFFALAESQNPAAPSSLAQDGAADFFASAVRELTSDRYAMAWRTYFNANELQQELPMGSSLPKPTKNIAAILRDASSLARAAGLEAITVDHLVTALLQKQETRLLGILELMGVAAERLLKEYSDARLGSVTMKLRNDVASDEDRLGYDSYARAITEFLTHTETPAPLSISIQAPWGGGKSSLMKLVRERLDPKVEREKHKPKIGTRQSLSRLQLGTVIKLLDRDEPFTIEPDESSQQLWTVWFNAWKYDTSEQIWAGLVDAIVSQIAERLPLIEREKFLLKLQLSRIDDGIVRKKIYDRVITIWWSKARVWILSGVALTLSLFGFGAAPQDIPPKIAQAIALWSANQYAGAMAVPILLSIYLVGSYFKSRSDVRSEPATFSLSEYIRVPNYDKSVGEIHQIHADLRRVLGVVPRATAEDEHTPIVIFIDDLDRCSPGKVASVVEGVSMLLASDTYRCIFIIGMDPQMVAAALEKAHEDVRKQLPRYERAVPLGWRFMDKFVQPPFTIPPTAGDRFNEYVNWLGDSVATSRESEETQETLGTNDDSGNNDNIDDEVDQTKSRDPVASSSPPVNRLIASSTFVESRDVGAIVRKISIYSAGNPREMKRMVNLARFYLALRSARRARGDSWREPDLDQYARWIAITLRWPDMMRWLQWGADEATWGADDFRDSLVVRRLRKLEMTAEDSSSAEIWKNTLAMDLMVPIESESDWACDPKLFEFFRDEGALRPAKRLSEAALRGFW
jgi:hypothetical protein